MVPAIADQLYAAGLKVFPCQTNKAPAVPKGVSWADYANLPPATVAWRSGVVGVPVPPNVIVIDLDTYKGVTREAAEAALGCRPNWDAALVQVTQQGGQHYAFGVQSTELVQGSDLFGLQGFDTRAAGRGYVATGDGYTWHGEHGLYALTRPDLLPQLPSEAEHALTPVGRPTLTSSDLAERNDEDTENLKNALSHIDPNCGRALWLRVGLALRNHYHDDEAEGFALFDTWSRGGFTKTGEVPANYSDNNEWQWSTFRPEGNTKIGTLFYEAMQGGWTPPATFDTAAAFGAGAAPADVFRSLSERIQAHGSDANYTHDLTEEVAAISCAPLQRAALLALLNRELKDAGLLTKAMRQQLDGQPGATPPRAPGQYGKNHTENALQFVEKQAPRGTLVRSEQVFYRYDGKCWVELNDEDVKGAVAQELLPSLPMHSTVTGTYNMVCELSHVSGQRIGNVSGAITLFQNGAFDRDTGQLLPHDPGYFTTNILPYDYDPYAQCDEWLRFMDDVFEGDEERVQLLQEWFGYMLAINNYDYHKVLMLLGPTRCGKGTVGRVLKAIVGGQNFSGGSLSAFADDAYVESLRTKSVVFLGDVEKSVSNTKIHQVIERVKTISGNDDVTFARKYKTTLSEALPTRIAFACNGTPKLFDDSGALAARLIVLPFHVSYLDREDVTLGDRLLTELPGIAIWALKGLTRLQAQGRFTVPAASEDEMQYLREAYSPTEQFLEEVCTLGGDNVAFSSEVYDAYKAWALTKQEGQAMTPKTVTSAVKDATLGRGVKYGTHRRGDKRDRGFRGITLGKVESITEAAFKPQIVK